MFRLSFNACILFFHLIFVSFFVWVACDVLLWRTWPEKWHLHCVHLDDARDKPLIDVSSARGLNEPRSGAFRSSRTDGEQTETDSHPLPPPYSFSIPLPFSVSLSLYTHRLSICVFWIPTSHRARRSPWISPSSTCHLLCGPTGSCIYSDDARLSGLQQSSSLSETQPTEEEPGAAFFGAWLCVMDLLLSEKSWIPWRAPWTPKMHRTGGRF